MTPVVSELVQVVGHVRRLPEQGSEQLSTGREKDEEHRQQKRCCQPTPQRHLSQRDAPLEGISLHNKPPLGFRAPFGSWAKDQSPDSRIPARPKPSRHQFLSGGSGSGLGLAPRSQWRDHAGLSPASWTPSPFLSSPGSIAAPVRCVNGQTRSRHVLLEPSVI